MSALADFIGTMFYAPCACVVEFSEFHSRFLEWLPLKDRHAWGQTQTRRALEEQQELCRGNGNKLIVTDLAFSPFNAGDVDESRMNLYRPRVRYLDPIGYVWHESGDGATSPVTLHTLIGRLRNCGVMPEEIYRLRKHWRANPISLSVLFSGYR